MGIRDPSILQAIGRVVVEASLFEQKLHMMYWHYAGVKSVAIGQIITGSERPGRLFEDVRKLASAAGAASGRLADLKDLSERYTSAAQKRNDIVHWIWHEETDGTHSIYPPEYQKPTARRAYPAAEINELADQFATLARRAIAHTLTEWDLRRRRRELGPSFRKIAPAPWLDTPARPGPRQSQTRARKRQPQRQR
jgi:hypothetical protein